MAVHIRVCLIGISATACISGCASPFDVSSNTRPFGSNAEMSMDDSVYRSEVLTDSEQTLALKLDASPESFIRYALYHSPVVEQAYQRWRSASYRLPQVASLPDPRLNIGFFLNEVETRVGPQQLRVGIAQTFPWVGKLKARKDAASKGALASWYLYQQALSQTTQQVVVALIDIVYLDQAIEITYENQLLIKSFEEVVRAKFRVGTGSHPQLIRIQLELAQINNRIAELESLRPVYIAILNAVLNRPSDSAIPLRLNMPSEITTMSADELVQLAKENNPKLAMFSQHIQQARIQTDVARKDGHPDLTIGLDYIVTDDTAASSIAENGDDPILLSFGINLPIWQEKYDAAVGESIAYRLSITSKLEAELNTISAQIYQEWFYHSDADRRIKLYEEILIPKAQESLSASLTAFRTGQTDFLDLLDTQSTLLEFLLESKRARADRGKALAKLSRLVGGSPTPMSNSINFQQPDTSTTSEVKQ